MLLDPNQELINTTHISVLSWSDDDYALEQSLISGLELNRRWRSGLFSVVSATSLKTRCHDEIARFLFATHPRFAEAYRVKPGAFVKAVKDRVQTYAPSVLSYASWRL